MLHSMRFPLIDVFLLVYRFFVGCHRQVFGGHLRVQLGSCGAHRRQFLQERTPERRNMDCRVLCPVVRTLSEVCARILESCQSFKGTLLHARLSFSYHVHCVDLYFQGIVKVAAIDADKYPSFAGRYGVQGFPTVKIFVDKNKPQDFSGDRSAVGITDEAIKTVKNKISAQLQGVPYGSSKSSKKSSSGDDVVELTDSNFDKLVLNSDDIWLVEFFAPWCGHCKNLAPHWAAAASELRGKVKQIFKCIIIQQLKSILFVHFRLNLVH